MLSRLSIRNYAIIERLEVEFSSKLNVITGETGAGKSIIVGALGLILGQRAEGAVLHDKEKKCIVEGCFKEEAADDHVLAFFKENELDIADELVVRREIAPSGKSRAFINDTPVNLSQLNELSSLLVDLHQQFDTLELGESDFQREVLDALAGNFSTLHQYGQIFSSSQTARRELEALKEQKTQFEKEFDYHQFQFNELEEAGFTTNELEDLDTELRLLSNAEGIKNALSKAYFDLAESEEPVVRQLKTMLSSLQAFAELHPELPALTERLQSSYIELQDIADELDRISNHINSDAERLEAINERLSLGYRLLKKHAVSATNELVEIRNNLHSKLQAVLNIDDAINAAEKKYADSLQQAESLAAKISAARKAQVKPLETQVNKMLAQVGMPNARIKVDVSKAPLNSTGFDAIEFLFDANKKEQFQPLRKVASGGELSRLMLCIKSLVATSMDMPTLIFDEIDTGISGEAAKQVGIIMKELAAARQVICITHQPQIAGKADAHYLVYKDLQNDSIRTGVRLLNTDERIVAIARMMSGERPTAAALENAREMVMN
ncbi:DNA repair protein RecN [Flavisolibacter ginsenosidimutans]|uniref:DNA repair protein RecN n=1 Tax=Flavisolibacter ginsenosidimutans TaxID=661481 RepID=A0A5B8UJC0_9BACT|nr:DNA repair protein RecN [Flavisolibacter ginsenosidimutans]QEC56496.1 DNA repair protein RecN [Flavisolibacter ginsenosidimutans]